MDLPQQSVFNALAVDREGLKPFRTFQYQRKTCLAFPVFLFPESPLPGGKDKDIEPGTASCCNNHVWLCGALQSPCYNALSTSLSCCPVEIRQSIQIPNIYSILIFFYRQTLRLRKILWPACDPTDNKTKSLKDSDSWNCGDILGWSSISLETVPADVIKMS